MLQNMKYLLIFFAVTILNTDSLLAEQTSLRVSTNDLNLEVDSSANFSLSLSKRVSFPVEIFFNYTGDDIIVQLSNNETIGNSTNLLTYTIHSLIAGHETIIANTTSDNIDISSSFVRVAIFKLASLNILSSVIGWLYFVCWSVSFYPQVIQNYRRKSVVGLNFDFLGLNLTGFIAYSVFNVGLRFSETVKHEYHTIHPTGVIPVEVNDVVFAVHAAFITFVTIVQCFIYERGDQLISKVTVAALALVWSSAGVFLLITALDINKYAPWLTFLYFFSYVKLLVTLVKYIPQVVYNYRRKSTTGWSIGTVLFDFVGGICSIMQMFIIAFNYNDWISIFGNFTKFGLGVASVTFDVIFMVQHYYLYPKKLSTSDENLIPEE